MAKDKEEKKEKKEKKEKGDKDEKKDKKDKKVKEDGEGKDSNKDKKDKKKEKKEMEAAMGKPGAPPPPQARAPPTLKKPKKVKGQPPEDTGDYLAGLDLPSTDDEEEFEKIERKEDEPTMVFGASDREAKKIADKERKASERAYQLKQEALREDDNVFDVAFEGQGGVDGAGVAVSATDIKVHNLTIRAKGKLLLESTECSITAGRRYGLAGPNGMGKSTLLRMIARRQIPVPDSLDVLLVEQEVVGDERSALSAVVTADMVLMELRCEVSDLTAKLEDPDAAKKEDPDFDLDESNARLNELYERMNAMGAATAESRASKILHGLGFTTVMQTRATQSFSGGWRMRISLARALFIQPTLLLLDEPTNHLDLRAVLWLEEYLQRWKKTLVVVSHDREFLNTVTTDIIHLHDLKLHYYKGNFAQFEEMYEQKRREANKSFDKFEKQLKAAKMSGRDARGKADKIRDFAARNQAKKNKNRTDDDSTTTAQPTKWTDYSVEFHFPEPTELAPPLIQLIDVDFKYPSRDDFGLKDLNMGVDMGSRIAIVGPNGAGKTTLMNLLSGDLEPTDGEQRRSFKLRIGRYAQHFVDALSMDDTPVDYLMAKYPEAGIRQEGMRAMLGRFGLTGHHHLVPICKLSGGQKSRVVFTSIALSNPHILLFDEPTNHLDMQSIDALCDAVEEFTGGVIVISHDAQLLSRICADQERSQVLIVEDGKIRHHNGDFDDYKDELIREIQAELDEE